MASPTLRRSASLRGSQSPARDSLSTLFPGQSPPRNQRIGTREEDVRQLQERLSGTQSKILVIHGLSGVGKSSLLNAGLLPVLREKTFSGGREGIPILLRLYQPWTEKLEAAIDQTSRRHKKSLKGIPQGSAQQRIEAKLRALEEQHCQVILVFDQFEEFFFANPNPQDQAAFFEFIGRLCSNIQQLGALKVVFSLRTDYVGYLLLCNDLESMDCINRDILSRQVLHKLGNLSAERTRQVLANLAPHLEAELRTRLVVDLSQEMGAVRPIELQLVGFQLESQQIHEMSAYDALGEHPKQQLVQGYLDDIVRACGSEQERLANGVLYLLTDERRTRPLRSYEELWQELQQVSQVSQGQVLQESLDLVLEIFTASGLVVVIPGEPQRYQLVHDYLAELIYESRQSELIASLQEERRQRLVAERTLEELEQRQTQVKRRTRWLSAAGVIVIAVSLGAVVWGNRELNTARLITRLERDSHLALQQFERNDELEALLTATRTARELQQATPPGQNYGTMRPIVSLSEVLRNIRLRNTWEAHSGWVNSAEFNGDGTMVVSASNDGTVKLWDVTTGELLHSLEAHSSRVTSAEFNGDGTMVVWASLDGIVKLWDATTGELLHSLEAHSGGVISAKFNRDGTRVVSASSDGTVKLWDATTGELLHSLEAHSGEVWTAEFNGDGTKVVSASNDRTVKLWDATTGELLQSLEAHLGWWVESAEFNGDSTMVVSASGDGTVKLWDVETGELLHALEAHSKWVTSAAFNGDGTMVVSASGDGTVKLWDVETGELLHSLEAHSGGVTSAEFNGDGTRVVSASDDGTVKLWDVGTGELLHSLEAHSSRVYSAEFNGDGTSVVSASGDGTVKLWDVSSELLHSLEAHSGSVWRAEFNEDGTMVVSASWDRIKLWDVTTGELLHALEAHSGPVTSAEFNGDGTMVVSASEDGTVKLWDVETGELLHSLEAHSGSVWRAEFNEDGTMVVSASLDGTVKLWDVGTGELLHSLEAHSGWVWRAEFNGDGTRLVSASGDGTVKLWDVNSGELLQSFESQSDWVNSAEFEGNAMRLFSPGFLDGDGKVELIDTVSGERLQSFDAHEDRVYSAEFNGDGTRMVSASEDGTVKIWDISSGKLLYSFEAHLSPVRSAKFNHDGTRIVSASDDGTVKIWKVETLDELLESRL